MPLTRRRRRCLKDMTGNSSTDRFPSIVCGPPETATAAHRHIASSIAIVQVIFDFSGVLMSIGLVPAIAGCLLG